MGRLRRVALGALLLAALAVTPASASVAPPSFRTVVVVLAPYLMWADVHPDRAPALHDLAVDSSLGNAAVRSGSVDPEPGPLAGAAILAAGRPVSVSGDGAEFADALLGTAVRSAGGRTAAVGSSAIEVTDALSPGSALAAVVARDQTGTVDVAETSARILRSSVSAPGGVTTDLDVLDAAYRQALVRGAGEARMPFLVVLDPGDPVRARAIASAAEWSASRAEAVATTDAVVRVALRSLPADAALLVVSTAQSAEGGAAGYGPVLFYGAGPGVLSSPGTRIDGVVTLPDVTATIISLLELDQMPAMTGSRLEIVRAADGVEERLTAMTRADASVRALEVKRVGLWAGTMAGVLSLFGVVLASAFAPALRLTQRARRIVGYALAVMCAVPVATLLSQFAGQPAAPADAFLRSSIALAAVAGFCAWWSRGRGPEATLVTVAGVTAAVVMVDQVIGAPAALDSAFSYSPMVGARFYGLGNEGAALLVGAALTYVGARVDRYGPRRSRDHLRLGALVVVLAVLPFLGANFGVAAWGTASFVAAYLYAASRRLDRRAVLVSLGAAAALVTLAAGIDSVTPGPSHLWRLFGTDGGLVPMVARKLTLSFDLLTATPVVVLLPIAIGAIAYLLVRPRGPIGEAIVTCRGMASALAGGVAAAIIGLITEDSGVAVAALVMLMPASALALTLLSLPEER